MKKYSIADLNSKEEMTIKIDRATYKKLQQIKMTVDKNTIAETISEMVEIYGEPYKQKILISKMQKKRT